VKAKARGAHYSQRVSWLSYVSNHGIHVFLGTSRDLSFDRYLYERRAQLNGLAASWTVYVAHQGRV
jgi:hypothetical protein